jgi:osmoprotectant transport system permease protein
VSYLTFAWDWLKSPAQWHGADAIPLRLAQHLEYCGLSLLVAALIAVPLGLLIGHTRRGEIAVINVANAWRAIPTLGLLVLMVELIGFSALTWLIPLVALAVPPILVNVCEGVAGVEPGLTDAARGMGMTEWQILRKVELPVALPLIMLGLRTGAIFIVATATIAADLPDVGGLGRYILDGLSQNNYAEVAGGALLLVILALVVQVVFVVLRYLIVPAPLRVQARNQG